MAAKKRKGTDEGEEATVAPAGDILDLIFASADGKESGWRALGDPGLSIDVPGVIPSGSEDLDSALGLGGWPLGRAVLVSGDEGSGKTTLALIAMANTQKMGGIAAYVDAEYKLDKRYARSLGCNIDRVALKQPESMEACIHDIENLIDLKMGNPISAPLPMTIVLDSLNAFIPQAEIEDRASPGLSARVYGQRIRQLLRKISFSRTLLFQVSQAREKIGVMFGDKKATACGKGPRFYATQIVSIEPRGILKDGKGSDAHKVGAKSAIEISKNQVAPPFEQCEMTIRWGMGIDYVESVDNALLKLGLAEMNGSWRTCQQVGLRWQGIEHLRRMQEGEDPAGFSALVHVLRSRYGWADDPVLASVRALAEERLGFAARQAEAEAKDAARAEEEPTLDAEEVLASEPADDKKKRMASANRARKQGKKQ